MHSVTGMGSAGPAAKRRLKLSTAKLCKAQKRVRSLRRFAGDDRDRDDLGSEEFFSKKKCS